MTVELSNEDKALLLAARLRQLDLESAKIGDELIALGYGTTEQLMALMIRVVNKR